MKIVKTAKLEIVNNSYDFSETIFIYKNALKFYIEVCEKEYHNYKDFQFSLEKRDYIEQITHKTSKRPQVKYDFGKDFHKFPSYFRRSVISEAIGIVTSHMSRLNIWKEKQKSAKQNNKKFYEKPPKLNYEPKSFPTFFKGNMFIKSENITFDSGRTFAVQ